MIRRGIFCVAVGLVIPLIGIGHPATERHIPIGQSPGDAARIVYGRIDYVSPRDHVIVVGGQRVKLVDETKVWLDASHLRRPTSVGGMNDCRAGRTVEAKLADDGAEPHAEWIKIRVER